MKDEELPSLLLGNLIKIMEEIGRPDAAEVLMSGCPFYRISDLEQVQELQHQQQEASSNGEHKTEQQMATR